MPAKRKHGGKRPGAGAPKKDTVRVRVQAMITPSLLEEIDEAALKREISRSAMLERLVKAGLLVRSF